MRFSPLAILAGLSAVALAEEERNPVTDPTTFNGKSVPPFKELTPSNWEEETKKNKFWMVKHYSPYCKHCTRFAPTFQTLYEFYYTSKPPTENPDDTFTKYYDFAFGTVNCVAYYDFCMDHNIQSYPTTILYEDGKVFDTLRGIKNMTALTTSVENALSKTHPGRPALVELPQPGDTVYPAPKAEEPAAEKKVEGAQGDAKAPVEKPAVNAEKPLDAVAEKLVEEPAGKNAGKSLDDITESPKDAEKSGKTESTEKKPEESAAAKDENKNTFGADWKVPTTGQMLKKTKPKDTTPKYNLEGTSVPLTPENFDKLVTSSKDPWFIKFYAPWCSHCKAMAPTWQQLAKNMQGKLNIGEVNCEADHKLCTQMGVKAFPTIYFVTGTEKAEYKGLRGVGDFVAYAEGALEVAGGVIDVDAESFKELEKTEEVLFVYFYDHATTTEDFKALDALPLNLIGRGKIVKTSDTELCSRFKITTWPRLLVSREGRATYYTPITPDEMRDVDSLVSWMKSTWLPLVPEMTAINAKQIMSHKLVVLAILNRNDEDRLQISISELKNAANEWVDRQVQEFQLERKKLRDAKQMRIEEAQSRDDQRALRNAKAIKIDMDSTRRKEVGFAWVDGIFWQRWIATTYNIDVRDGERIIINEEDRHQFWDTTPTGNQIMVSHTSIMDTLDKIVYGPNPISPKYTIGTLAKFFFDIKMNFVDHPFLSMGFVIAVGFGLYSWIRNRTRRSRGTFFRMDDSLGLKDGLLGQNGNDKSD
ncbi:hypothetical protein LB506_006499 [Fusarium annulatum]|uniref:Related to thioredoxin domain containing protein 5 n=1 Tax=Fusarium proliferatum (strain ET1) TaxID=1227346 RepID=A0A1L7VAI5_FUSPR|nr:uncharacterized protein FPRO_02526 [Fusarium proliferatum ET1]KAI1054951.1 hypothetical protein LB506_006499 [Fusarium annulatum]CZR37214.1 related to thioredoxin domain containing protein 5 precursor [Fusarium proliferatum ET1]